MTARGTVLVVDDEPYVRESLAAVLGRKGYAVRTAAAASEALQPENLQGLDAVITDLRMPPPLTGLDLLRRLSESDPRLAIIVLTGHGSVPSAVECMKAGAFDYLLKPLNPEGLTLSLERALNDAAMRRELEYLRAGRGRPPVGVSRGWREVLEWVDKAAPADTAILLVGESGTGKEEVAKLIHGKSQRFRRPFIRVNCAAIPIELFESEFFGHRRGAFTGSVSDREGRFRLAHGGTLFLDEIGSMPEAAQAKVLRVLQDGVFERVGESRSTMVDVRLICASNTDLEEAVDAGTFRRDLFYRINVVTIRVPPLRERREDIPVLAERFLEELAIRLGKRVRSIHRDTLARLTTHPWPGNVRELRNVIERAVLLEKTEELLPSSLPFPAGPDEGTEGESDLRLRSVLAQTERRAIEEALRRAHGVRRETARLLGIDPRNLGYFLKKHGLAGAEKE